MRLSDNESLLLQLLSDYLGIVGCRIGTIQSKAIADSGISTIEISRNK